MIAFFQDEGILPTDKNELNSNKSGPGSAVINCLTRYGEKPSGSRVCFGLSFLITLCIFFCGELHRVETNVSFGSMREVG